MKTRDPKLTTLLENVRDGAIDVNEAVEQLRNLPYEDLGYANLDHHRADRKSVV